MRRFLFPSALLLLLGLQPTSRGQTLPANLSDPTAIPPKIPLTPTPVAPAGTRAFFPSPEHAILATKRDIAAIDPAKVAEIRKMFELTHAELAMTEVSKRTFAELEKLHPQVLPHVWNEMKKEMGADQMLEQMIYVYDRHFSLEDIKAMNAFYESPTGKRVTAMMPLVARDSFELGQQLARNAALKVAAEVKAERGTAGVAPSAHHSP